MRGSSWPGAARRGLAGRPLHEGGAGEQHGPVVPPLACRCCCLPERRGGIGWQVGPVATRGWQRGGRQCGVGGVRAGPSILSVLWVSVMEGWQSRMATNHLDGV